MNKEQYKRLSIVLTLPLIILGCVLSKFYSDSYKPSVFCYIDGGGFCYNEIINKEEINTNDGKSKNFSYNYIYGDFYIYDNDNDLYHGYFLSFYPFPAVKGEYRYRRGLDVVNEENVSIIFSRQECQFSISSRNDFEAYCPNISEFSIPFKFTSNNDSVIFEKVANESRKKGSIIELKYLIYNLFIIILPLFFYFLVSWLIMFIVYGKRRVKNN